MRVGIATISQLNDNYGGTLQAFALLSAIERLGHEPFLLNTSIPPRPAILLNRIVEHPIRQLARIRRYGLFMPFWRRHWRVDPLGHRPEADFLRDPTPCDACVCGSDQVWARLMSDDALARRFAALGFGPPSLLRVAYAPSFGSDAVPDEALGWSLPCLRALDALSVREESGVGILARAGLKAQWVVDPTLLHGESFWSSVADESGDAPRGGTVFLGALRWKTAQDPKGVLRRVCGRTGWTYETPCSESPLSHLGHNVQLSPAGWLRHIRESPLVVTNSFHCMVFSVIFRRPFVVLPLSGRHGRANDRLLSFARRLGLEDRFLHGMDDLGRIVESPVDWTGVHGRLEAWRAESWSYLENALSISKVI